METDKLNCTIDFDYDLIQDGCHWKLDRYFTLTFTVNDPSLRDSVEFYYRLGPDGLLKSIKNLYNAGNTWIYELKLSGLTLERTEEGWTQITACIVDKNTAETKAQSTLEYRLELPPVINKSTDPNVKTIQTTLVNANPGELICSWPKAIELDGSDASTSPDDLDGYCIEFFHKPAGSSTYTQVDGLKLVKWLGPEKENLKYTNEIDSVTGEKIKVKAYELTKETTATSSKITSEVYLELTDAISNGIDVESPKIYFTPKDLGINPGDGYKFIIYPYSHYEGALIASQGVSSDDSAVSKGVVRVCVGNNKWVEGQVWVCISAATPEEPNKITWVPAEAIYTKTSDKWVEAYGGETTPETPEASEPETPEVPETPETPEVPTPEYTVNFYKSLNDYARNFYAVAGRDVSDETGIQEIYGCDISTDGGATYSTLATSSYRGNFASNGNKLISSKQYPHGTKFRVWVTYTLGDSIPIIGQQYKETTSHIYVNGNLSQNAYAPVYEFTLTGNTDINFEWVLSGTVYVDATANWNCYVNTY